MKPLQSISIELLGKNTPNTLSANFASKLSSFSLFSCVLLCKLIFPLLYFNLFFVFIEPFEGFYHHK